MRPSSRPSRNTGTAHFFGFLHSWVTGTPWNSAHTQTYLHNYIHLYNVNAHKSQQKLPPRADAHLSDRSAKAWHESDSVWCSCVRYVSKYVCMYVCIYFAMTLVFMTIVIVVYRYYCLQYCVFRWRARKLQHLNEHRHTHTHVRTAYTFVLHVWVRFKSSTWLGANSVDRKKRRWASMDWAKNSKKNVSSITTPGKRGGTIKILRRKSISPLLCNDSNNNKRLCLLAKEFNCSHACRCWRQPSALCTFDCCSARFRLLRIVLFCWPFWFAIFYLFSFLWHSPPFSCLSYEFPLNLAELLLLVFSALCICAKINPRNSYTIENLKTVLTYVAFLLI